MFSSVSSGFGAVTLPPSIVPVPAIVYAALFVGHAAEPRCLASQVQVGDNPFTHSSGGVMKFREFKALHSA